MRPVVFGEALPAGTRLTLFLADKPDRFFTVNKFWIDKTSGVALARPCERANSGGTKETGANPSGPHCR
jgi:hypothetical protein